MDIYWTQMVSVSSKSAQWWVVINQLLVLCMMCSTFLQWMWIFSRCVLQQLMASLLSSVRVDVVKKSTGFEALYHWTIITHHFLLIIPASQYCNTQSNYFSNDKNPTNGTLAVNFLLFEQRKEVCEKYKCQADQKLHHNHQTFTNERT